MKYALTSSNLSKETKPHKILARVHCSAIVEINEILLRPHPRAVIDYIAA